MDYLTSTCAAESLGPANALLATFLSTFVALHCNITQSINWPRDYGEIALEHGFEEYDFIVVGAGSAGSVVAGRLAENPKYKVLLIEAGGDPPIESEIPILGSTNAFTAIDWQYITEATVPCLGFYTGNCYWPRGKALGGSHAINGMMFVRGNSRDYDEWELAGNSGWGWSHIQNYFRKTENFRQKDFFGDHGKDGPMTVDSYGSINQGENIFLGAAKELGYKKIEDFVAGNNIGFGTMYGTFKRGRRMTTAKAFLTKGAPNLHVLKHAIATKILFQKNRKANRISVTYKDKHPMQVKAKKEIIVSAGSVETPKLLMLSGIGPQSHLEALNLPTIMDLPVGKSLQDHIRVDILFKFSTGPDSKTQFLDEFYNQAVHQDGPFRAPALGISGFINTLDDPLFPDIQYAFIPIANITQAGFKESIIQSFSTQLMPEDKIIKVYVILLRPKSLGHIRLRSADYKDSPLIYPNYYFHSDDESTMIRGIKKILAFENTKTFGSVKGSALIPDLPECSRYEERSNRYWSCYMQYMSSTTYHPVGTAKMGPEQDPLTVVDSCLRVHGVKGLRVIDASIMPNIVSANTNAATIMIAEKGADLIKMDWA